jgi:phi13 family phage major tail protein
MAYFGVSSPYMASLDVATETYSDGFKCGKAISTSVTPSYSSAVLYADNAEAERVDEFVNAAVEVGTDRLPAQAAQIVFGHTITDGVTTYKGNDSSNYVGYGFWVANMEDGVKKYQGVILHKVKFTEGQESFQTKGENIQFATPTLTGSATVLSNDVWKTVSEKFTSLTDAEVWIKTQLNIALTYTAVTPAAGDNPKAKGWYERTGTGTTEDPYVYTKTTDTTVSDQKTYYEAS